METQWLIKTDLSAAQVAEPLRPLIEPGDALVVVEVKNDWAAPGLFGTPAFESLANVFH